MSLPARQRPTGSPAAVTPMAFARAIVAAYKRYGQAPDGALHAAQITPAQLRHVGARITARQLEALSATAMQELDDEGDFRAGQLATIKVHVGRGTYGQRPVVNASVTVKVLGTTFRPMIQSTETDERGVAVVRALLPRFNAGRAAIIIRAADRDDAVEMRRIIHQS